MDKIYSELEPALSKCKEEGGSFMSQENGSAGDEGEDELLYHEVQHL